MAPLDLLNLKYCDFYFWGNGNLKGQSLQRLSHTIEEQKKQIKRVIKDASEAGLRKVANNLSQ